ncbi:hypothetical protein COCMIDRAFT_2197 [Bipolaris oryzae ATCC 44560]|uniref:Uncharacterized protein n=1 Tax=Bipolaris oryzae ATCC 44560 TaxID=930090 RepID=W6ZAY4_COCMI|nr:uncharacterized protein COCMIDRAFT_2197 [Bipolaris oryzae ATCC 44560]EUC48932.1 hypothetical protein COCMIDRAFT_2197 [Bipolaris oryzae ATCC 44560]
MTLARITEVVQQAYFNFCEKTWDISVVRIDQVPDGLEIHWADKTKSSNHFSKFPEHLTTSQNVREATLVAMCCNEPLAHLHGLIKALVEGMPIEIQELQVFLRSVSQKVTIFSEVNTGHGTANWPNNLHEILRIKSKKTNTQWVIDITGAQYGIRKALWDWRDYERIYMVDVWKECPFGDNKSFIDRLSKVPGVDGLGHKISILAAGNLNQAIKKWEANHKSLAKMLILDEEAYQVDKASLLESMDAAVRSFVTANNFNAQFREAKTHDRKYPDKSRHEIIIMTKTYRM